MSRIADSVSLASLNLPGTHDSGARYEPFPNTAKCQTLFGLTLSIGIASMPHTVFCPTAFVISGVATAVLHVLG